MGTIYRKESRTMCGIGIELIEMIKIQKDLQKKKKKKKKKDNGKA